MLNGNNLKVELQDEQTLWSGKPNFLCFALRQIFDINLLFFVLISTIIGSALMYVIFSGTAKEDYLAYFLIIVPLVPILYYIYWILTIKKRYNDIEYILGDKTIRIYKNFKDRIIKSYSDIERVDIYPGLFQGIFNLGSNILITFKFNSQGVFVPRLIISDIENCELVVSLIKSKMAEAAKKEGNNGE